MATLAACKHVTAVGESALAHLGLRPDYAVTIAGALTGFVELKAPGKGADPRSFTTPHDRDQGRKLLSLPNVLFTDGNAFSLWQNGELVGKLLTLDGDIRSSGAKLAPPAGLQAMFEAFLTWTPSAPDSAKALAHTTARLCRFLREEAVEQLARKSPALTSIAQDWRKLLFPEATDERFADGYAQAVTFGLLMARAKGIALDDSLQHAADELSHSSTLIGAALHLLTEDPDNRRALKTSLSVLTRVLNAVDWSRISKGNADAWLYFYEDFLETYDKDLRKKTGSYYTPPEVVEAMVSLVDEALRSPRFNLHSGLASPAVTIADPATGTGTFPLGILRRVAKTVAEDQGEGAVPDAIDAALSRIIAFEMQLGPFAVAQLRILAEVLSLTGSASTQSLRMFVTNTLGNPDDDEGQITGLIPRTIADSRKRANKIKRDETITVVIGNPPYKEKAKGKGGWVEGQTAAEAKSAPLRAWQPPAAWGFTSTSGAGPPGRSSTPTPSTPNPASNRNPAPASSASSRSPASSTAPALRKCATTSVAPATTSGSSTAPPKATNPPSTPASSRVYNSPSASLWLRGQRPITRKHPLTFTSAPCHSAIVIKSSRLCSSFPCKARAGLQAHLDGANHFYRNHWVLGQPTRRLKISSFTTALGCKQSERG
jgi:hypothetical protein